MTERLYYHDSYLREFPARVTRLEDGGRRVYLDRTAFYPASGGQPSDRGELNGIAVVDVVDEDAEIAHLLDRPLEASEVTSAVDWTRRRDFMQQHSGQHLLSAVFAEQFGFPTVSVHMGEQSSTVDLETPSVETAQLVAAERRANELVCEDLPIAVSFEETAEGLRKASERAGTLRIVSIGSLDRSACGGTHVRSTGEIGPILLRRLDKVRGITRVEFLCGLRATARARRDFETLAETAQVFSAALDEVPDLVRNQLESARSADKRLRKLELELAGYQGKEAYAAATPDAAGVRYLERILDQGSVESLRGLAQSFCAGGKAICLCAVRLPPSVLLAASADSGMDAGARLKAAVQAVGGRGGGNPRLAQGSVPSADQLEAVLAALR
ncbi:MAG: alanyl-tRNA editing protein [Bryobacteraceae bacterium]